MKKTPVVALVVSVVALVSVFVLERPGLSARGDDSAYDRVMAKNELVCGVIPWAPYKVYDPNTKAWSGFGIDLYRKAFATLDIKVAYREVILGNQVQDLNSGRVDAICDDGPWTMSAGKFVEYSDPAYYAVIYPFVRNDEARFSSRKDFNKKEVRFVGIDGDLSNDLVGRIFPQATLLSMPGTTDVSQLFLNVADGKADVALSDQAAFAVYNANNPNKLKPLFLDDPMGKYKTLISVKKGDFKMLGLVNQAIDNALTFGLVDEVLDTVDPEHKKLMRVRPRAGF
jgi:ABC-type amino acid transport substrate-binding protein